MNCFNYIYIMSFCYFLINEYSGTDCDWAEKINITFNVPP